MNLLLLLIALHFVGDFAWQTAFLAMNKGKSWEILFYHCVVHASPFIIFMYFYQNSNMILISLLMIVIHFIIDALKARYNVIKEIWQDQLAHLTVVLAVFFAL